MKRFGYYNLTLEEYVKEKWKGEDIYSINLLNDTQQFIIL